MESSSLQELQQIPGVGKTIARDMQNIGIHSFDALKHRQATRDTSHQRPATLKLLTWRQKQLGAETLHYIRNTICEVRNSLPGIEVCVLLTTDLHGFFR